MGCVNESSIECESDDDFDYGRVYSSSDLLAKSITDAKLFIEENDTYYQPNPKRDFIIVNRDPKITKINTSAVYKSSHTYHNSRQNIIILNVKLDSNDKICEILGI